MTHPPVLFRLPMVQAKERFAACDICCVDLDQCLFPTFTQTILGSLAVGRAAISPSLWPKIPNLLGGGYYLVSTRLRQLTGRHQPTNSELMARFSSVMSGMPMNLIESLARLLPRISFPGWRDSLAIISSRMPTGLLSFAIQPIIEAYRRTFGWRGRPIFDLASGTPVEVTGGAKGPVLLGCYDDNGSLNGQAKLRTLNQWMDECKAKRPLVIGHGPDEAPMADYAREQGGLSIGFRPTEGWAEHFDLVVNAMTWRPVTRLLRLLQPSG